MRIRLGDPTAAQDEPLAKEGWYRIHSPGLRTGYLLAGLIGLACPNVLCAWLSAVSMFAGGDGLPAREAEHPTPWGAVALVLALLVPMHELIHAVWHPRWGLSPQTVLIVWPRKLRFGVYYEGCMTRRRWLVMRIAPLACLSVFPVGLLTLLQYVPAPYTLNVFLQVLMLANGIGSGGDLVAVAWVLFQVPARAHICFRSGRAYWRLARSTCTVSVAE